MKKVDIFTALVFALLTYYTGSVLLIIAYLTFLVGTGFYYLVTKNKLSSILYSVTHLLFLVSALYLSVSPGDGVLLFNAKTLGLCVIAAGLILYKVLNNYKYRDVSHEM